MLDIFQLIPELLIRDKNTLGLSHGLCHIRYYIISIIFLKLKLFLNHILFIV